MDDLISKLSEIRGEYNCFDQDEEPQYRALSEAIKILSQRADGDTISRQGANEKGKIDKYDVLTWLLHYHKLSFDLHGRYFPHEVIGWLVADISKNLLNIAETEGQYGK